MPPHPNPQMEEFLRAVGQTIQRAMAQGFQGFQGFVQRGVQQAPMQANPPSETAMLLKDLNHNIKELNKNVIDLTESIEELREDFEEEEEPPRRKRGKKRSRSYAPD